MVHPETAAALGEMNNQARPPAPQSGVKAENLSRPILGEEITEVDWGFFLSEWSRYKRSTGLTGQNTMDQLWACAADSLKKNIKATNKLVNVVQFLSLAQDTDEPVTQYISKLKGQSSMCDFEIKCSWAR